MARRDRIIVVSGGGNGSSVIPDGAGERAASAVGRGANGLLKNEQNDSILKKVIIWGAAGFGTYFGAKFLLGTIGKDLAAKQQQDKFEQTVQNAASGASGNSLLALQLVRAINPKWSPDSPKSEPSHNDVNESEIFRLLAGPMERDWLGQPRLKTNAAGQKLYRPIVNSRQSLQDVSSRYTVLTFGRSLTSDLYEFMDIQFGPKNDYNALKPYLDRIQCLNRVATLVDPKTKKILKYKIVAQNCPPLP